MSLGCQSKTIRSKDPEYKTFTPGRKGQSIGKTVIVFLVCWITYCKTESNLSNETCKNNFNLSPTSFNLSLRHFHAPLCWHKFYTPCLNGCCVVLKLSNANKNAGKWSGRIVYGNHKSLDPITWWKIHGNSPSSSRVIIICRDK